MKRNQVLALLALIASVSGLYGADNANDGNSHNGILNVNTPSTQNTTDDATVGCGFETEDSSPVRIRDGEFIWSDTDVVLNGRPSLYLNRNYRAFDSREGLFGKGWSTRCEKSLIRVVGFVNEEGDPTSEPVVKYIYISSIGKRYEFLESAPDVFIAPDGMPGSALSINESGSPSIRYIDGSTETFNSFGKLTAESDRNGNTVNFSYSDGALSRMADTNGRYLDLLYDSSGHVTSVTDHTGRAWLYSYNADGSLASVTDPANGVLRYDYTPVSRAFDAQIYPVITQITDESGVVNVSVDYDVNGRVASYTMGENTYTYTQDDFGFYYKTDSFGSEWSYVTDEFGRKTEVLPPINNGDPVRYEYDENGNVTKLTDLVGTEFTSTFDELGRLTSSTDPDGTVMLSYQGDSSYLTRAWSVTGRTVEIEYDERGNPVSVTDPIGNVSSMRWNAQGDLLISSDPLGNTASQDYNSIGLVIRSSDPLNRSTSFTYDSLGNLIQITDAAGEVTTMEYDVLDRLISTTDALGHVTQYSYDAAGRLLSVIDAAGGTTTFAYDIHGRLASETRADDSVFTYAYRSDNLLESMTDPRGVVTRYTYDAGKRMTQVDAGSDRYTYSFDVQGRVIVATSNASTLSYTYDTLHRVLTETQDGRTTSYSYNAESELVGLSYEGEDLTYAYDDRGLLTAFVTPSGTHAYVHDAAGRMTRHTRPNGSTAVITYDAAYQLLEQDYSQVSGEVFSYVYDNLGRIAQTVGDGNADWTYRYDAIHRLVGADHEQSYAYQYDSLGNRIENGGIYDLFNKLLEDNNFTYSYDEMGSLISKVDKASGEVSRYAYDGFARMVRFEKAPSSSSAVTVNVRYAYDPFGRRVLKSVGGFETLFHWTGSNMTSEYNSNTDIASLYRYDGGYVASEYSDSVDTYNVLGDYLGSAKRLLDQSGEIKWKNQSDPYGSDVNDNTDNTVIFKQGFPGQYSDEETGLKYNIHRYYGDTLGRYLRGDPIGISGGLNAFTYSGSSPSNNIDPSGLDILVIHNGRTDPGSGKFDIGNPFGHTAIAVEGLGIFSYGNALGASPNINNNIFGGSLDSYVRREVTKRNTHFTLIKTTSTQDQKIVSILSGNTTKSGKVDNCAVRVGAALNSLRGDLALFERGEIPHSGMFPSQVRKTSEALMKSLGGRSYYIGRVNSTQEAKDLAIPDAFKQFEATR